MHSWPPGGSPVMPWRSQGYGVQALERTAGSHALAAAAHRSVRCPGGRIGTEWQRSSESGYEEDGLVDG